MDNMNEKNKPQDKKPPCNHPSHKGELPLNYTICEWCGEQVGGICIQRTKNKDEDVEK